jgi:hypothetical protein
LSGALRVNFIRTALEIAIFRAASSNSFQKEHLEINPMRNTFFHPDFTVGSGIKPDRAH